MTKGQFSLSAQAAETFTLGDEIKLDQKTEKNVSFLGLEHLLCSNVRQLARRIMGEYRI